MIILGGVSGPSRITFFSDAFTARAKCRIDKKTGDWTVDCTVKKRSAPQRFLAKHPKLPVPKLLRKLVLLLNKPKHVAIFVILLGIIVWSEQRSAELTLRALLISASMTLGLSMIVLSLVMEHIARWHGAEHMAVTAYERYGNVSIEKIAEQSPVHKHCGGRFLLPLMLVFTLSSIGEYAFGINSWISFLLLAEAALWIDALIGFDKIPVFKNASEQLQKHITTDYPGRDELVTAYQGMQTLIRAHEMIEAEETIGMEGITTNPASL